MHSLAYAFLHICRLHKRLRLCEMGTLQNILWKLGYPDNIIKLVCAFDTGMKASVSLRVELIKSIEVGNGVNQDCILAHTLFSFFLSRVLSVAFTEFS